MFWVAGAKGGRVEKKGIFGMGVLEDRTHWREKGMFLKVREVMEAGSPRKTGHRFPLIVQNGYTSAQMKNRIKRLWKYKHQRQDHLFFPTDENG